MAILYLIVYEDAWRELGSLGYPGESFMSSRPRAKGTTWPSVYFLSEVP